MCNSELLARPAQPIVFDVTYGSWALYYRGTLLWKCSALCSIVNTRLPDNQYFTQHVDRAGNMINASFWLLHDVACLLLATYLINGCEETVGIFIAMYAVMYFMSHVWIINGYCY